MSTKRQDAVEAQHVHEQGKGEDLDFAETTEPNYLNDEISGTSDIEARRKQFFDSYQKREAQLFKEAQDIAITRLDRLSADGFSDQRGGLDKASTADAVVGGEPYDYPFEHLSDQGGITEERGERSAKRTGKGE